MTKDEEKETENNTDEVLLPGEDTAGYVSQTSSKKLYRDKNKRKLFNTKDLEYIIKLLCPQQDCRNK